MPSKAQKQNMIPSADAGCSSAPLPVKTKKEPAEFQSFGDHLKTAMGLAELSNVLLSHLLHTDASLISRYRSGLRSPKGNPALTDALAQLLYERIEKNGRTEELAREMQIPAEKLSPETFSLWLYRQKDRPSRQVRQAEQLLSIFDSYSTQTGLILPSPEEAAPEECLNADVPIYYGAEGLREAVLRFLGTAARDKAPTLLLYSDEQQSWLTEDPGFTLKWASLMNACVKNGTRICIIHNIDRSMEEMINAIRSWLPLYMSGMIESFYSKKQPDQRFSHTIFLRPGVSCIRASHVRGTEADGFYRYYTDSHALEVCAEEYEVLMDAANPLFKSLPPTPDPNAGDVSILRKSLSLATMPEALIDEFGDDALRSIWEKERTGLQEMLCRSCIREYAVLAGMEDLLSGRVETESLPGIGQHVYTPQQYALHLQNIIHLTETEPGYHFCPVQEMPFPKMKLFLSEHQAQFFHSARPSLSFGFTHPLMCQAFLACAESLAKQCPPETLTDALRFG